MAETGKAALTENNGSFLNRLLELVALNTQAAERVAEAFRQSYERNRYKDIEWENA